MATGLAELTVSDAAAWRQWLAENHEQTTGVWLVLAKKGTTEPTSLSYDEALDEALCHGWIDGQVQRRDERTYKQRFTPRRARSKWSKRNVGIVARLLSDGRMHPAGLAAVEEAKADGRWEIAYSGQAAIEVPDDLTAALDDDPPARSMFEILTSQNRYFAPLPDRCRQAPGNPRPPDCAVRGDARPWGDAPPAAAQAPELQTRELTPERAHELVGAPAHLADEPAHVLETRPQLRIADLDGQNIGPVFPVAIFYLDSDR